MAQYMREPLLVLDVIEHEDAHVQRYMYKCYRLEDGSDHKSGYVEALSDRDARDYLYDCWLLHVMPMILILRHHKRHFAGVQHGELLAKWNAEGDPGYAELLDPSYEWRNSINRLAPGEDIDLQEVNLLERDADIDAVVIKSRPMDERLRIVLAKRGLPTLNKQELDEGLLDDTVCTEEQLINEAYGIDVYASNSQSDENDSRHLSRPLKRALRVATGDLIEAGYVWILRLESFDQVITDDRPSLELLGAANREAFVWWSSLYRADLGIPAMTHTQTEVKTIREWLLGKPSALRHLFAYLPYPELEAKMWPHKEHLAWGIAEIHQEQTSALERIMQDQHQPQEARNFCTKWYAGCSAPGPSCDVTRTLAGSADRWKRLRQWVPSGFCRDNRIGIPASEWAILHVLPYVVASWHTTPMGRVKNGARSLWYQEYSNVKYIYTAIVSSG